MNEVSPLWPIATAIWAFLYATEMKTWPRRIAPIGALLASLASVLLRLIG